MRLWSRQVLDGEVMELFEQIKRLKENQLMRGTNLSSQSQFNKLDKPMNEHEKFKEEEMKKLLLQFLHFFLFKFSFLERKYDELNEKTLIWLNFNLKWIR